MAYQVDTTGAAYALDATPLMKIQDKMAATQMASIQGAQAGAMAGLKAIEDYQARKQMANMQTQVGTLKPGSPTFETDIAKLVFSNPLAFNNENTAQTARTGLTLLGQAHAARLREKMHAEDRGYQTERDKAAFNNRLELTKEEYKLRADLEKSKQGTPPDPNAMRSSIEGTPLPSENVPATEAAPDPNAMRSQIEGQAPAPATPDPTQQDGQPAPPAGGLSDLGPPTGASAELLPPLPAEGNQGVAGPRGAVAPPGVAVPRVGVPTEANRAMRGVPFSEQQSELERKIGSYADTIKSWRSQGFYSQADALIPDLNRHQKALDDLKSSPDYMKSVAEREAEAIRLKSAATATAARPEIVDALASQHADIFTAKPSWDAAMRADIESAKTATALQAKQAQWSSRLQMAAQSDALPDDPKDFDVVIKREAAYRDARDKLNAANVPSKVEALAAMPDPTGTTSTDVRLKADIAAARQEVSEGASKYEAAKRKMADEEAKLHEARVKAGLEKPEEKKPEAAAPPVAPPKPGSPAALVQEEAAAARNKQNTDNAAWDKLKEEWVRANPEAVKMMAKAAVAGLNGGSAPSERDILSELDKTQTGSSEMMNGFRANVPFSRVPTQFRHPDPKQLSRPLKNEDIALMIYQGMLKSSADSGYPTPKSKAEADALPSGTVFKDSQGNLRTRP